MSLIRIQQLYKSYLLNKISVPALKGINFTVETGDFVAIAGPSGSGKTTLLNIIGCIDRASAGEVYIDGTEISSLTSDALAQIRADKISFIFQNFNLFPVLTALENVEYPLHFKTLTPAQRRQRAQKALDLMGLLRFANHKPLEMSGGQQQRVAIARAIVREPLLILADEPTANLDHKTGTEIVDLMRKINGEQNTTFIFSTHDQKVIERAKSVVKIWDGEIA